MTAPRRRRRPEEHASRERWLVSYADFITLLFAFFTTMYAISTVDAQKLSSMVESLQRAFPSGVTTGGAHSRPTAPGGPATDKTPPSTLPVVQRQIETTLAAAIAERRVDVERRPHAVVVSIREFGSFPSGSAEPTTPARTLLAAIGATLKGFDQPVRVEGHTDDAPIHSTHFASNWELSAARATNVVAFFIEEAGLAPERLSAAGYASYHPRGANDSDTARARNRRVDIVILDPGATPADPVR